MGYIDQSYMATPSVNPSVYKYVHVGTAAGTTQIGPNQPILIGYVQLNSHALGTLVAYDSTGTSANVIGSVTIQSVSGSAPLGYPMFASLATKNALCITNTANLDLTIAYLP